LICSIPGIVNLGWLRVSSNERVNRGKLRPSFTPFAVNAICASTLAKRVTKQSLAVKFTWVDPEDPGIDV
jgi:hypothetical protein